MMQELLNGTNVGGILGGERSKLSNSAISEGSPNSQSPLPGGAASASENLRCPRCDSSNTKFCYYNNYNLTQPRHFCKTCRRYWTKGGALRNVPIGGGCRKNKSTAIATVVGKSSSAGKLKTVTNDIAKSALFGGNFDQAGAGAESALASNPVLWPQNSHFLSLLRSNQNPNPNLGHLPNSIKEEGPLFGSSNWGSESSISGRIMNLDPLSHLHITTPNPIYRNQTQTVLPGELQSNGYQELYQRLRSSTSCYSDHQATAIPGNIINPSSHPGILESAPVSVSVTGGGELGFWNSTNLTSWPTDLPTTTTTNGAYP